MSMERLKAIHDQLDGALTSLALIGKGVLHIGEEPGTITAVGVRAWAAYSTGDISITDSEYQANSAWPNHEHQNITEYLICSRGCFEIRIQLPEGELKIELVPGAAVRIPPRTIHSAQTTTGGCLLAVCIPPEPAYVRTPKGNSNG